MDAISRVHQLAAQTVAQPAVAGAGPGLAAAAPAPSAAATTGRGPIPYSNSMPSIGTDNVSGGGGFSLRGIGSKLKNAMLYAAMGAAAGMIFPVIPGGPVGGAFIGAAISLLF